MFLLPTNRNATMMNVTFKYMASETNNEPEEWNEYAFQCLEKTYDIK